MGSPEKNEGTAELIQKSRDFERQFGNPDKLTPVQVFERLGFREIHFSALDPKLQKAIKTKSDWYGHPFNEDGKIKEGSIIVQHPSGLIIYFFCRNGGPGLYEWSCLRKTEKNGYEVYEISRSSGIKEIIGNVSLLEIIGNQGVDTGMPLMPPKLTVKKSKEAPAVAKETREQIKEV